MKDTKKANANLVDALGSALRSGDHGLKAVPGLVKRVLQEEAWRGFVTQRGELVEYDRIDDFVVTPPLKGLGATPELIETLIHDDVEALTAWTTARKRPAGRPARNVDNIHDKEVGERPSGTSKEAGLRRLSKDRPDLHAQVLEGALSTNAAMVQAGFWRPKLTVPIDTPENTARALRRNLDPEAVAELGRLLTAQD